MEKLTIKKPQEEMLLELIERDSGNVIEVIIDGLVVAQFWDDGEFWVFKEDLSTKGFKLEVKTQK